MRRIHQGRAFMLGLIPVMMVTAACSSPAPKATSQPAPRRDVTTTGSPGAHDFVSNRYGFWLTPPKDWSKREAQVGWDGKEPFTGGLQSTPFVAIVSDPGNGDRKFAVAAAPVAKGIQLAAWQAAIVRVIVASQCASSRPVTKTTLGGEPALTWTATCGDLHPIQIAALHGRRGYLAIAELRPADPRIVESILQSFHFTS